MDAADLFALVPMLQVSLMVAPTAALSWSETSSGYSVSAVPVPAAVIHNDAAYSAAVIYNLLLN